MIMPPLPCAHAWRPLFPPETGSEVTGGQVYRVCPECDAIAVWRPPFWETVAFEEAHRLRVLAAYLRPAAPERPGATPELTE